MFKAHSTESNYISNTNTQIWSPRQDPHLHYTDCWQCSNGDRRGGDSTSAVNYGALGECLPVCILLDLQLIAHSVTVSSTSFHNVTPTLPVVYRGGWFGGSDPHRNSKDISGVLERMSKKEPGSRFPFAVHCVLIQL